MKVKMNIMLDERQSDYQRRSRAHQMALDSEGGQMLIGLAAENKLPEKVSAFVQQKIFENPDLSVRTQAKNYFTSSLPGKDYPVEEVIMLKPEKERGAQVFNTNCSSCHKSGNRGNNIGPDLSFVGQKLDDRQLINAIINPDASIAFGYEPWLINMKDNTSVYGFMIADNEQAMTIRDISGKNHVIEKTKIASARKQDKSVMPDAVQMGLTQQDLRNVVEYLKANSTTRRNED